MPLREQRGSDFLSRTVVVQHFLENAQQSNLAVFYYYFEKASPSSLTTTAFLRSLLKQLLMYHGMIASNRLKLIRQRLDRVFANDSLPPHDLDLLQFCIDLTRTAANTVCVIDGLHELSGEEASKVCGIIEELLQPSAAMKIAVFARETVGTDIQFDRLIPKTYILRLVLPLLTKDISTFVEMSVDRKMQREREISSNQRLVREIKDTLIKAGEKMSGPSKTSQLSAKYF